MSTVSIMSTYAAARAGVKTTLIISGKKCLDCQKDLSSHFGLEPVENYDVLTIWRSGIVKTSILFYLRATFHILKNARRGDLVISRNTNFLPYLYIIKLLTGAFVLFEAHGYHGRFEKGSPISKRLVIEQMILGKLSGLVSLTKAMEERFRKDYPTLPVITLPLGAPSFQPVRISLQEAYGRRCLCYTGRLTDVIDADTVLGAVALCSDLDLRFLWIGLRDNEQERLLRNKCEQLNISSKVELYQWMGHREMCGMVQRKGSAGIAAYQSTYDSNVQISPTKLFDFFSFGLPVIGSDVGAVREILQDRNDGLIYKPGNREELASRIRELFTSFDLFEKLCKSSERMANLYSWENRARRLMDFTSSIAARRTPNGERFTLRQGAQGERKETEP